MIAPPAGGHGAFTGTTAVTIVPAPRIGKREVTQVRINNLDSIMHVVTIKVVEAYQDDVQIWSALTILAASFFHDSHAITLEPGQSITAVLAGSAGTAPTYVTSWSDVS